jgi:uncharacterized membrane protein YphA (DoxX/SURF4 family)
MKKAAIIEIIVTLYAILFLYTAISKWMDYTVFKEQVAMSPILKPFAKAIAIGLPWTEILVTILLIVPKWRLKGLYAACLMMTAFTIYITATLAFSDHIPCSCGGVIAQMSWTQHLIFNTAFIGLSIIGIVLIRQIQRNQKLEWSSSANRDWNVKAGHI